MDQKSQDPAEQQVEHGPFSNPVEAERYLSYSAQQLIASHTFQLKDKRTFMCAGYATHPLMAKLKTLCSPAQRPLVNVI